jgi:capsular polysaccharide biosynthesis protein
MTEQPLDLRRTVQIVRRNWIAVAVAAMVGLVAGGLYPVYKPPLVSSYALVELSTSSTNGMATEAVVATSDGVLTGALSHIAPVMSELALRSHIKATALAPGVLSINAEGRTATEAEATANAVAHSYIAYLDANSATLKVQARLLQSASNAVGPSLPEHVITTALLGLLLGALVAVVLTVAFGRRDRRLRQRDEIADAIGVPVLASLPVAHPRDAANWRSLLEEYKPDITQAWRLRNVLRYLGLTEGPSAWATDNNRGGSSVTVLSLSEDRRALALGPHLAVFAASLGIPTALIIGHQQDTDSTATLRAACAASPISARRSSLRVAVADHGNVEWPNVMLTVVVAVVDGRAPKLDDAVGTATTVLAVSAGVPTAEQLARVAASAGAHGHEIEGILIADPSPTDPTTGRIPHLARPERRVEPTRLSDISTEIRR